jgi:F-type H+-transporting ATPase subunit gamma
MPSLRDIRRRIGATRSTEKITKAMKMVAAAKFRKAQEAVLKARPFSRELRNTLTRVGLHKDIGDHPLFDRREPFAREDLFVLTSDRGLCGAFNANVMHQVERYLLDHYDRKNQIYLITLGRKANQYFKKQKANIRTNIENFLEAPSYSQAMEISEVLAERFIAGEVDTITLVYNEFKSAVQQKVMFRTLLPLDPPAKIGDERDLIDYLYEPEKEALLDQIIRRYLANQLFMIALESVASEHGARMTAMENATNNAGDMVQRLTMKYNKARQSAITKELMEIVSGAEALKTGA